MSHVQVLAAVFVVYVLLVTVMMRRALTQHDPLQRQTEAKRLLLVVTLGVPLAIAAIFYAM